MHSTFTTDLADMQLIIKFNKGTHFLLYVIDIFSKYAWFIPLKDKKGRPGLFLWKIKKVVQLLMHVKKS